MTGRSLLCASIALAAPAIAGAQVETERARRCRAFRRGVHRHQRTPSGLPAAQARERGALMGDARRRYRALFSVRSRDKTLRRAGGNTISVSEIASPSRRPSSTGRRCRVARDNSRRRGACLTGAPPRDDGSDVSGYWGLADERLHRSQPRSTDQARDHVARGGRLAVIDRLAPVLVPERHAVGTVCGGRGMR